MAARLFQSILLEIKEKVPFMVGVVDQTGNIISCTEIKLIGDTIESASAFFASGREAGEFGGYTFQLLNGYENGIEYAVFCANRGSMADTVCALTAVAISNSKSLYDEKHDRAAFIKRIILSNILTGDIYIRAYFAPIEYELPLSYIANSQGIYNETMVDFTIESPNQTFITDEDFMDSLTGEEDRYIDEQNKSFGAWVVGVDGNRLLQSGSSVDDYTVSVSTSYITIEAVDESGYWTLIRSVDNGNTFVSIEGYTYYVVLGLRNGSYGDLGEEIIILKWSNTYTVRVSNNDLNYWSESGIDRDEYIGVGSIGLDRDGEDILLEVKFNSRYAYPFMSSIMKNRALSFYKGS